MNEHVLVAVPLEYSVSMCLEVSSSSYSYIATPTNTNSLLLMVLCGNVYVKNVRHTKERSTRLNRNNNDAIIMKGYIKFNYVIILNKN